MPPDPLFVLGFAFGAGMVAFFSPCCVAMLPAYVSYSLRKSEEVVGPSGKARQAEGASRRLREAAAIGAWAGLFLAALGLGALALEALSAFGLPSPPRSPAERESALLLATAGIALVLLSYAAGGSRQRLRAALLFGLLATAGFLAVFIAVGVPVAIFAFALKGAMQAIAVAVGAALVLLGVLTLAHIQIPLRIRSFVPKTRGPAGFFLFGIAYGLASLSCTFPIFLAVVALAAASLSFAVALGAFAAYALGKGFVMVLVTALATASPAAVEGRLRAILPRFDQAMATIVILSGAFLVYYFGVLYPA